MSDTIARMGEDELTQLADVETDTRSVMAWGMAEDYDEAETRRIATPGRITGAAVVASLIVVAVAALVVWQHARPAEIVAAPVQIKTKALTSAPVAIMPPTVTIAPPAVTVTAPAPAPQVVPAADDSPTRIFTPEELAPYDRQFVAVAESRGWDVTDPALFTMRAHQLCASLEIGESAQLVTEKIQSLSGVPMGLARAFTNAAISTYPKCYER